MDGICGTGGGYLRHRRGLSAPFGTTTPLRAPGGANKKSYNPMSTDTDSDNTGAGNAGTEGLMGALVAFTIFYFMACALRIRSRLDISSAYPPPLC